MSLQPRFPLYIPTKSRAEFSLTARALTKMSVLYRLVVEEGQRQDYIRAGHDPKTLLTLDPEYQRNYNTCDDLGSSKSKGPGPARNFIWDHSISEGYSHHWVMDDNIIGFARLHKNQRIYVGDGLAFHAMEEHTLRYKNIAMSGPNYWMFALSRQKYPPFVLNTRIYSCNFIRNDVPFRWRGRYNEDTILSLDMLEAGWCTVQYNAFLQHKITTQAVKGGNTEEFYSKEGTYPKSQMLAQEYPEIAKVVWKFHRWHHYVNYNKYKSMKLIPDENAEPPQPDKYRLKLTERPEQTTAF